MPFRIAHDTEMPEFDSSFNSAIDDEHEYDAAAQYYHQKKLEEEQAYHEWLEQLAADDEQWRRDNGLPPAPSIFE